MSTRNQHKTDWITAGLWLLLCLIGWAAIYSSSFNESHPSIFDFSMSYGKQFMWICVSIGLASIILLTDSQLIKNSAIPVYAGVLLLLILVLFIGKVRGGARSWFGFGSFGIQPSEFSKVAIALFLSSYISDGKEVLKSFKNRLVAIGIVGLPAVLILLQPDTGTVLILFAFILVLYREGLSGVPLLAGASAIVLGIATVVASESNLSLTQNTVIPGIWVLVVILVLLGGFSLFMVPRLARPRDRKKISSIVIGSFLAAIVFVGAVDYGFDKVLKDYQKDRIRITLQMEVQGDKWADWNIKNSKAAIGNGGLTGEGFMKGPFTQYRFVPEQNTDFIFCTIGEEWGFMGSAFVVLLFAVLIMRIIVLAERQRSTYSRVFGYCVACVFLMHFFINIGMVMGVAPVIGIPLPFFSYGGSSMMAFSVLLFIFIKLDSERMVGLR